MPSFFTEITSLKTKTKKQSLTSEYQSIKPYKIILIKNTLRSYSDKELACLFIPKRRIFLFRDCILNRLKSQKPYTDLRPHKDTSLLLTLQITYIKMENKHHFYPQSSLQKACLHPTINPSFPRTFFYLNRLEKHSPHSNENAILPSRIFDLQLF